MISTNVSIQYFSIRKRILCMILKLRNIIALDWPITPQLNWIKYVAYSSQGSNAGQLDFYNRLADGSTR